LYFPNCPNNAFGIKFTQGKEKHGFCLSQTKFTAAYQKNFALAKLFRLIQGVLEKNTKKTLCIINISTTHMSAENQNRTPIAELWKQSDAKRQEILTNPLKHPIDYLNILIFEGFSPEQALENFKNLFQNKNKSN
jgi:hypothetical protein